jgi:hypothetical protein
MKRKSQNQKVTFIYPYILNCIDSDNYEISPAPGTEEEKLKFLYNTFISEYWYIENQKYYHNNIIVAFSSWLQGLPSSFNVDYENYRIIEMAKEWGSLQADANDKQEDKILNNWWNFIAVNTFQLFKKYKVC